MEEKEMTPQEWEITIKEKFSQIDEAKLLEYAQDAATLLASGLCLCKASVHDEADVDSINGILTPRIGRMAVLLDVLQLKYGDAAEEELELLEGLEDFLEG